MIQKSQFQTASRAAKLGKALAQIKNQKTQFIGLTAPQSEAIRYILKKSGCNGLTASDLMESLQLSQSTVAGIIQRLEGKGLISRTVDKSDNRKNIIRPTEKGLELEEALKETAVEVEKLLLKGMKQEEKVEFNRLLQLALENLIEAREKEYGKQGED